MAEQSKKIPKAALRFSVSEFKVGDNGEKAKTAPVKMVARSGEPTEHWYWGRVVHDLAGMKLHKDRLAIDYCHFSDEVLGFLNKFDTTSGDLVVSGAVTPFRDDDRASEVLFKSKQGVPYEASINFAGDGIKIEELGPGAVATVNGRQFEGPGIIIREWPLRGVAICPYGQDMRTETQFKADDDEEVAVTIFSQESAAMSDTTTTTTEEAAPATEQAPAVDPEKKTEGEGAAAAAQEQPPVEPGAETATPVIPPADATQQSQQAGAAAGAAAVEAQPPQAEEKPHDRFVRTFGDQGAKWFLDNRTFEACAEEFIGQKTQRITELEAENKSLRDQLAALPRGNDAATFQAAHEPEKKPVSLRDHVRVSGRKQS